MKTSIIEFYPSTDEILVSSMGCKYKTNLGKEYIDLESGVWCANLGHSHPRLSKIYAEQSKNFIHQGYKFRNLESEKLSAKLNELAGFKNGSSVFLSSGSEAVNLSISLAQHITGRKKIVKITNSYLSAFGFGQIKQDNDIVISISEIKELESIDFNEVCAFVLEVSGASVDMVKFPTKELVEAVVHKCKSNGVYVIAEEVTTGMGRLGKWFGFQLYDINPDMLVAGKALGNGYPISALLISDQVNNKFEANIFRYAQSHQNDPMGCRIALEVISIFEQEQILDKVNQISFYFEQKIKELIAQYPQLITSYRIRGLMIGVEFNKEIDATTLNQQLFENGYVFTERMNIFRMLPPLVISYNEVDEFFSTIERLVNLKLR
jgi:acetylornithine aminotransferase